MKRSKVVIALIRGLCFAFGALLSVLFAIAASAFEGEERHAPYSSYAWPQWPLPWRVHNAEHGGRSRHGIRGLLCPHPA
jgi:hypothetical protein